MKDEIIILFTVLFIFPCCLLSAEEEGDVKAITNIKPDVEISENHIKQANLSIENYRFEEAIRSLKEALLLNPFSTKAYYNLGLCYKRLGLYDKAEKELKMSLRYGKDPDSLKLLAVILKYKGKYEKSRDLFLEVLNERPENKEIIRYLEEMETIDKKLQNRKRRNLQ